MDIIRRGLGSSIPALEWTYSPVTGLPVFHGGKPLTTEDVRALEDDW